MMPSRNPEGDASRPPVLDALLSYLSYGFSVLPILPGKKSPFGLLLPEGKWSPYQQRPPTVDEVTAWANQRPDTGVGIVCGQVSGGLYVLDLDNIDFSAWVEARFAENLASRGAWVVRTGSNRLHVWIRSVEPMYTSVLIGGRFGKLADIRGDGQGRHGPSYACAPPTIHPSGKPYETMYGSPEHISRIRDAQILFNRLRDEFLASQEVPQIADAPVSEELPDTNDESVLPYPTEEEAQQMQYRIETDRNLSRKTKRALIYGAQPGEGLWSGADSRSEIDHYVVCEMRGCGWDIPDIERAFAWTKLGSQGYRRRDGSFGRGYIARSATKADKRMAEAAQAAKEARGHNFIVERVVRVGYEEPVYEVHVRLSIGDMRSGVAVLTIDDLMDSHRFKRAVGRVLNFFPQFDKSLDGRKFEKFGQLLLSMAEPEAVPETATSAGHMRGVVMMFVLDDAREYEPENEKLVGLGWRHNGLAYLRGVEILRRMQNVIRPAPKPDQVWAVMRGMGGQEIGYKWPSGRKESLWVIPLRGAPTS